MTPADFVRLFAGHKNAGNLLMVLLLMVGLYSLGRLNTQFFPDFDIDIIQITVPWAGASADDVDRNIVDAIEPEVRFLDYVDNIEAFAREGAATIVLEYEKGVLMQQALSDVESSVARLSTLPDDAEDPIVTRVVRYEPVSSIVLYGPFSENAMKAYAKKMRDDLLDRGVDKISFFGARDEEIVVEVLPQTLRRLDMTIADVAGRIGEISQDIPSGNLGGSVAKQLRSRGQVTSADGVAGLEVRSLGTGEKVYVGDLGRVSETFNSDQPIGRYKGYPAVELSVSRSTNADALEVDDIVKAYLTEVKDSLPPTIGVVRYDIQADLIRERIAILVENGISGLLLVGLVLMLFLDVRLAFWVAVGIPVSMFTALALMDISGQTINMISLFGIIMTLGIVVDDAIVVGEHSHTLRERGLGPLEAAQGGALRMLAPVTAASLTTIVSFAPIFMISGTIGSIVSAISFVAVAVLVASLLECMLILPVHLRESYMRVERGGKVFFGLFDWFFAANHWFRMRFDPAFDRLRDVFFRRLVVGALNWRYATLSVAVTGLLLSVGVISGGHVGFQFFPTPESNVVQVNFSFVPGTPSQTVEQMIDELDRSARQTEEELGYLPGELVVMTLGKVGSSQSRESWRSRTGSHLGGVHVELVAPDQRVTRTRSFITEWRRRVSPLPGLEKLAMSERGGGPPGRELDIRLKGNDIYRLKAAAIGMADVLARYPGVSDTEDDLPVGKRELVMSLTPRGQALGLNTQSVARQVRDSFEGAIAKRFTRGDEEVLIRVQYAANSVVEADLPNLTIKTPSGQQVFLSEVVSVQELQGFARIKRENGKREVAVTAEIDEDVTSSQDVIAALEQGQIQDVADRYGLQYEFRGKAEERRDSFAEMGVGAVLAFVSMYIILAWVFASYSKPFAVMLIIPFGLVGAVIGHMVMDFAITFLSMIALLGLSGILVNDSIILVSTIDERQGNGESAFEASANGAVDRLRAVLLTSLTTIGGLTPLMFETSRQAQFLIPMAITIVFGLMVATVLVLVIVPCLIVITDDFKRGARSIARYGQ